MYNLVLDLIYYAKPYIDPIVTVKLERQTDIKELGEEKKVNKEEKLRGDKGWAGEVFLFLCVCVCVYALLVLHLRVRLYMEASTLSQ